MTLTELLEHIRLQVVIEDTNITDAQITVLINQAIHEIAVAADWPWLEASTTITLSDSTQTYALSSEASDFNRAQALVDDDNDETVEYISPSNFFALYGNDTGNESTQPRFWTIWEDNIYISPIPEDDDTNRLTLYYYKNPTELSAGGDTPGFDEGFHWIIVEYAKWKLYEWAEYYDQAQRAAVTFVDYLEDMERWYSKRTSRIPFIVGDGTLRRQGDPNIPSLWRI